MLCPMSHSTNPNANVIPAAKASQNQRANRAPASTAIPTTIGATHPVRPMIGFGNPKTLPCHEPRFAVHCTMMLKSHEAGPESGFCSAWNFSTVSANAAPHPMTPAMMSQTARAFGRDSIVRADMARLWHPCLCVALRMRVAERRRTPSRAIGSGKWNNEADAAAAAPQRITEDFGR